MDSVISALWDKYLTSIQVPTAEPFTYKYAISANSREEDSRHRFMSSINSVQGGNITALPTRGHHCTQTRPAVWAQTRVISLEYNCPISCLCFSSLWKLTGTPNNLLIQSTNKSFQRKIIVWKFQLGFRQITNIPANQVLLWVMIDCACWNYIYKTL